MALASDLLEKENVKTALEKFDEALEIQKNQTATERAEFYYEIAVDSKACSHCPEYVSLIREVNNIVEKMDPPKDVTLANKQLVEIDRLKFMYFEKVASLNGNETCSIFDATDPTLLRGVDRDKLTLVAEELVSLPQIASIQYYPQPPQKEIRYFYRGEGLQSHILIEVIVKEDKSAVIRYHHYNPYNLPNIGIKISDNKFNEFEMDSRVGGINVKTDAVLNISEQTAHATLKGDSKEWVKIEAKHQSKDRASIKTIIPLEVSLPDSHIKFAGNVSHEQKEDLESSEHDKINRAEVTISSKTQMELIKAKLEEKEGQQEVVVGSKVKRTLGSSLEFAGEIERREIKIEGQETNSRRVDMFLRSPSGNHEFIRAKIENEGEQDKVHLSTKHTWTVDSDSNLKMKAQVSQTRSENGVDRSRQNEMVLSLTDQNHEYVTARVVQGNELDDLLSLTSRYGLSDKSSVSVAVDHSDSGKKNISFGHQMTSGKNSIQTSVGRGTETGNFINFSAQRKISETASMVLNVQADSNHNTTLMYQYQSKF